jgi:hypothetical protein
MDVAFGKRPRGRRGLFVGSEQMQEPEILSRLIQLSEVLASPRGKVCYACSYGNA